MFTVEQDPNAYKNVSDSNISDPDFTYTIYFQHI